MTAIETILVILMPTLNMFLSVAITLEATIQNNLSKSRKFLREISVVEFRYSETILFEIYSNFTHDYETYDIVKHYYDSLIIYLSLNSIFFSN